MPNVWVRVDGYLGPRCPTHATDTNLHTETKTRNIYKGKGYRSETASAIRSKFMQIVKQRCLVIPGKAQC
jgi:hypothetical protein